MKEIIITTGPFSQVLENYCYSLKLPLNYTFVYNPIYDKTNYIYSIYIASKFLNDDILMMHGDLVFDLTVLKDILACKSSCMVTSSTTELPAKDFKAVIKNKRIKKIGIEFFDNSVSAQPFYKMNKVDWIVWLDRIKEFCESGRVSCYAEDAFNEISSKCSLYPMDIKGNLCSEIDTYEDLYNLKTKIKNLM